MANRSKLTIDFKDRTDLVDALRMLATRDGVSQREIVADALQAYFSHRQENSLLLDAANRSFAEWENEDDKVYDSL